MKTNESAAQYAARSIPVWLEQIRERIESGHMVGVMESCQVFLRNSEWVVRGSLFQPSEVMIVARTSTLPLRVMVLMRNGQIASATLQYREWATPWVTYPLSDDEQRILEQFARHFLPLSDLSEKKKQLLKLLQDDGAWGAWGAWSETYKANEDAD